LWLRAPAETPFPPTGCVRATGGRPTPLSALRFPPGGIGRAARRLQVGFDAILRTRRAADNLPAPRRGCAVAGILAGGPMVMNRANTLKPRCEWPGGDPLMLRYHDLEWGVPVHDDVRHFEFLILEGAQAGLSWRTVLYKREDYREAFAGFDAQQVARFGARKVESLLKNPGIIRNRLKIAAAVTNARAFLAVQEEFGSFDRYVWPFVGGRPIVNRWKSLRQLPARTKESDALSADLKKRGFKFVGSTIVYAHMQAVGMVNDHLVHCYRHRQCARRRGVTGPPPP
jgi:DNA-3-methyladenine glycosylase I